MPKTQFRNGVTVLTADWANHVQDHVHDGMDEDGHAPKVDLKDHLDTGTNGYLEVAVDTNQVHTIEHKSDSGAVTTLESGGFKTTSLQPNSSTRSSRQDTTLYQGNLVKLQSVHTFRKERGENVRVISVNEESSYNLGPGDIWEYKSDTGLYEMDVPDHHFSGNVQATIEQADDYGTGEVGDGVEVRIRQCRYDSLNHKLVLRLVVGRNETDDVTGHSQYKWRAIDLLGVSYSWEVTFRIHVSMI